MKYLSETDLDHIYKYLGTKGIPNCMREISNLYLEDICDYLNARNSGELSKKLNLTFK
jgi:hypothetical protein